MCTSNALTAAGVEVRKGFVDTGPGGGVRETQSASARKGSAPSEFARVGRPTPAATFPSHCSGLGSSPTAGIGEAEGVAGGVSTPLFPFVSLRIGLSVTD